MIKISYERLRMNLPLANKREPELEGQQRLIDHSNHIVLEPQDPVINI